MITKQQCDRLRHVRDGGVLRAARYFPFPFRYYLAEEEVTEPSVQKLVEIGALSAAPDPDEKKAGTIDHIRFAATPKASALIEERLQFDRDEAKRKRELKTKKL